MDDFAQLPNDARRLYFEQAATRRGLLPQIVEKDFWVCWTLRRLFSLDEFGGHSESPFTRRSNRHTSTTIGSTRSGRNRPVRDRFGALAGALHGRSWIPSRWYDNIANGPGGRDQIVQVARRLANLSCDSD